MPSTSLIDSHCHLDFDIFDDDRMEVLQRAKDNDISDIVIPGTERKYWERINQLCTKHSQLHACYGLHPYWVKNHDKKDVAALDNYINHNNVTALGECGLDFRAEQADKKTQLYFFEAQLDIAENCQLPVVIHSVRATETVLQSIKKYNNLKGMIHSYSGSAEQALQLIDLNFHISLGGSVTYDNAKKIRTVAKNIPLTSLLIETDSPDQADQLHSGERNEPAYLINTVNAIAALRQVSAEVIAEQTTINAKELFAL